MIDPSNEFSQRPVDPADASISGPYEVFDGELILRTDGLYTKAHFYTHRENGRQVLLVGMNHVGDPQYYFEVEKLLRDYSRVLHEGHFTGEEQVPWTTIAQEGYQAFQRSQGPERLLLAIQAYFPAAAHMLELADERLEFNYVQENWTSVEPYFETKALLTPSVRERRIQFDQLLEEVPEETSRELIDLIESRLRQISDGSYRRQDLVADFIRIWSVPELKSIVSTFFDRPRNEACFELFDKICGETEQWTSIAIKFGAAHMSNQRELLESRGYALDESIELKNLALENSP